MRSEVPLTVHQRVAEVGAVLPSLASVTGWASLAWLGGSWFDGRTADGGLRPVAVATGRRRIRPQTGVVLCEERWDPRETTVLDGIRVSNPVQAVCFEMRYARSLTAAVVALAMAAHDDLVSLEEAQTWVDAHPGWTGIEQARQAVRLAPENAWSPMEAVAGVCWVRDAGRPTPLYNSPVFDLEGRRLTTPDLIDARAGVVLEYDGGVHAPLAARRRDRDRAEVCREHDIECATIMEGDLRDAGTVAQRIHAAYARARPLDAPRTWTVEQPSWWTDTSTVERRRALTGVDRDIWLRYRRHR